MNKCPRCGQPRQGEEYKCPHCDCFYSQLDEILAEEEADREKNSFKTRLKNIRTAANSRQALWQEFLRIKRETPKIVFFTFFVIFTFVFWLVASVTIM